MKINATKFCVHKNFKFRNSSGHENVVFQEKNGVHAHESI